MLVEIARQRDDLPVRVLSPITIPKLAELQGRNGIGKSLTIKLLQLLTGEQPWGREAEAWETLRSRLGPTSVTVSGLRDGQTIEWDLNPDAWPHRPPDDVADLSAMDASGAVGIEARVDGTAATPSMVRQILRVHRLVGDETLEDSVDARIDQMERQARSESDTIRERATGVRAVLAEATQALEPLSRRRERELKDKIHRLGDHRTELAAQVANETKRAERLRHLEARQRTLGRLAELETGAAANTLQQELREVNEQLAATRLDRDRRFDAAVADVQLRQRIEDAREEVERVQGLLARAVDDARQRAIEAGLDGRADARATGDVSELREHVSTDIRRMRETLASQDAVPLVRRAAAAVQRALARTEPQSVLDHPIAVIRDHEVTGRELSDGINTELALLERSARHPSGEQLEKDIAAASARLDAITELERARARERRHTTALQNRRTALLELSGAVEGDTSDEYIHLEQRISELEDRRRELQGEHFRHEVLLGELGLGEDLERAHERLRRDVLAAGVVMPQDLADTLSSVEGGLRELDYELRRTEADAEEAQRDLKSAVERRELAAEALRKTALIQAMGIPDARFTTDRAPALAEELLRAVERVEATLRRFDVETVGAVGAFGQLRSSLLSDVDVDVDVTRIERVRQTVEREIVSALNRAVLRKELFEGGTVEAYDQPRRVISFLPPGAAEPLTRSLSAFSSGERVFAYTQMQLRAIREIREPTANRVVVLDEFGAFLESRRIRALEDLVRDELLGHGIDRVLFILPLTSANVNDAGFAVLDRTGA